MRSVFKFHKRIKPNWIVSPLQCSLLEIWINIDVFFKKKMVTLCQSLKWLFKLWIVSASVFFANSTFHVTAALIIPALSIKHLLHVKCHTLWDRCREWAWPVFTRPEWWVWCVDGDGVFIEESLINHAKNDLLQAFFISVPWYKFKWISYDEIYEECEDFKTKIYDINNSDCNLQAKLCHF